jgi:hypothetical protein
MIGSTATIFLAALALISSQEVGDGSRNDLLNEVQSGWDSYMDQMAHYQKATYVYSNSLGETPEVISHDGNNALIFRADRRVIAFNAYYGFQIERKDLNSAYELQGIVQRSRSEPLSDGSDRLPNAVWLTQSLEMFKSGMVLFPNDIPLSQIDFRDSDWGVESLKVSSSNPNHYTLSARPKKKDVTYGEFNAVGRFSNIREVKIVLDKANYWLPVSGQFVMDSQDRSQAEFTNWQEEAKWEFVRNESGIVVPHSYTFTIRGGDYPQFDEDRSIRFQKHYHQFAFSKDLDTHEFRISRFGFQEPSNRVPSNRFAWIIIPLGIVLIALGVYLSRRRAKCQEM